MKNRLSKQPRDPFVHIILTLRESRRSRIVAKAEAAGVEFQQWALAQLENA